MADIDDPPKAAKLTGYATDLKQSSVSGLSSGAFMAVQLHLAHSEIFVGAGVIAGGPCRCVESFETAGPTVEDAYLQNAYFVCMSPLTPQVGPQPKRLTELAAQAARKGLIDSLDNMARQRLYIFTGAEDSVVNKSVVEATKDFYELLRVPTSHLQFVWDVPAGHAILTTNLEDSPLGATQPPFLNRSGDGHTHSWHILNHIYNDKALKPATTRLSGELIRFDQREFFDSSRASMSPYGYVYVPDSVRRGARCRIHVVLHGCKQGYNYVEFINGRADRTNYAPYGNRFITTTGYNEIADANDIVVLYPQVEGIDDGVTQNPEGCWDWWGYSCRGASRLDYYSKNALQISAIYAMIERLANG